MPLPDWHVCMPVGHLLTANWCKKAKLTVGSTIQEENESGMYKKSSWASQEKHANVSGIPPWFLAATYEADKPFLPELLWSWCLPQPQKALSTLNNLLTFLPLVTLSVTKNLTWSCLRGIHGPIGKQSPWANMESMLMNMKIKGIFTFVGCGGLIRMVLTDSGVWMLGPQRAAILVGVALLVEVCHCGCGLLSSHMPKLHPV